MTQDALIAAAKIEKVEFLVQVTRANPEIILTGSFELFFDAVRYRRTMIFNLLRGFSSKHLVAKVIDEDENEIKLLHLAASLAPSSYRNQVTGAALQLQRELQWFKVAESMVDPAFLNLRHKMNLLASQKQPLDHFKDNHRELSKEGERWLQNTATSCSVVGTLILTIMFGAACTVPGGNHQDLGYPILLEHKLFKVFLISDALSLFSATASVLTFLGILTSHYEEEDFLYSLPQKLIIGFSTLFLSIATMTVAFSVTIIIMLQHDSSRLRVILPIAVLAGIPIISFVLLQFRVLVQVISSTYGRGTFKKKVDKWP